MKMRDIGAYVLDACFPNICDCCGNFMAANAYVCPECEAKLRTLRTDYQLWLANYNGAKPLPWQHLITVYAYEDAAKAGVLRLKQGSRNFGAHLAEKLAVLAREQLPVHAIDFVTWVPLSAVRRRECYYGHSEYLARRLAKQLDLPVKGGFLTEEHTEQRQHQQTAEQRAMFVERFHATKKRCEGQTILLCDDILTTGSTLKRCTELLLQSGAKTVYAAVPLCTDRYRERNVKASDTDRT
ncbi:MAG: phosphoribosyltransferase family protein [Oscillospiraceae bacterium]|nr:phosphoribosyltransferase family protein [Oscillospiraceae bacterium]